MAYEMVQLPPWWLRGRPADLWLQHSQFVEKFIKEAKLTAVDPKLLVTKLEVMVGQAPQAIATATATAPARARLQSIDIRGGIRLAHLHFGNDVFLLDAAQWKTFSRKLLGELSAKLSKASAVSFDQLLDLSDAVDTLQM
jgi:hypothetical protein